MPLVKAVAIFAVSLLTATALLVAAQQNNFHNHFSGAHAPTNAPPQHQQNSGGGDAAVSQQGGGGASTQHQLPHHHSLTLVLNRGDPQRCFYVNSRVAEDRMFFEYRVRNGRPYLDVEVKAPDGNIVFQSLSGEYEESEGNKIFFIARATGEYSMCLSNAQQEIVVTVNAAVASKKRATQKRDPVLRQVSVMKANLEALLQDQEYLRSRERSHRDTLETHNTQVVLRFLFEVTILLAMSVGQVFFLKRLFDKKTSRPGV